MAGLDPAIQGDCVSSMGGFVYILASKRNGTLYIGVTSNLVRRIQQHRDRPTGFVARYNVQYLVWYEHHQEIGSAIQRETSLKRWKRAWKLELIEASNPNWTDLWDTVAQ